MLEVVRTLAEFRQARSRLIAARAAELSRRPVVGFTPTMGALHAGHASLCECMAAQCDVRLASIFVNPLQFNASPDLEAYPRTFEADLALCQQAGVELVYAPGEAAMYPPGFQTTVTVNAVTKRWEGVQRPGHFDGVATVVTKLFNLARPDKAYFGAKDFQQLVLVERLAADLDLGIQIVPCPTVREADGLALSSRNARLNPAARTAAAFLFEALSVVTSVFAAGERSTAQLLQPGEALLASAPAPGVELEYLAIVDAASLEPRTEAQSGDRVILAAQVGGVRLIDNMELKS